MKRRDFLRTSGYFVTVAALGGTSSACGDDAGGGGGPDAAPPVGTYAFPQGVASGDPRDSSVVLWTRVQAAEGTTGTVEVTAQVADSADFSNVVVEEALVVTADSDHTLRLLVTGLSAGTRYYYRFTAGADTVDGQTRTAPAATDDASVRFAWASCQDYGAGYYGAWRQMINDDDARDDADQIQFVVFLGDFIYETIGSQFQAPLGDDFEPLTGTDRTVEAFPDGSGSTVTYAETLADYRHLYKQFLRDPDLRAARARWPFIATWDDHEFTNDSWQSMANFTDDQGGDEPAQTRKVAANQAWFEFMPSQLTGAPGVAGVTQRAKDFAAATVTNEAFQGVGSDNLDSEPNNRMAVDSLTIYRSFRYGANIELVMTDQRSYRTDHPIPEEATQSAFYFDRRNVLPAEAVLIMDAGREANGGNPPDTVPYAGTNVRKDSPPGSMLGETQKQWFKDTIKGSTATWKIWGNEVPMMRLFVKNQPAGALVVDRFANCDAWDGYNYERNELMQYIRDEAIDNVVVITGDFHASLAGHVMDDHEAATPAPVVPEFIAAGISSNSLFSFFEFAARGQQTALRNIITFDASADGGESFVRNLNMLLMHGTSAASTMADQNDRDAALAAKDPEVNPHLKYADTDAQGYGVMLVTTAQISVDLVTVNRPTTDSGTGGPGVHHTATFTVDADDVASLSEPSFSGTPPFPFAAS